MLLPPNTPQGVADTLGYLQHHLHELTERQNVSKNNINIILAALTVQLQQLTQLVANSSSPPIPHIPPPLVPSPLVSLPPIPMMRQTCPKLSCPPDFSREHHNGHAFLNFCSLYIHLALEQFHDEHEKILWTLTFFKGGPKMCSIRKWTLAFSPSKPGGTPNNSSRSTSSLLTWKQMQSML